MKKIISIILTCVIIIPAMAVCIHAETDYSSYIGKWDWEESAPLADDQNNWYTYDEAWIKILDANNNGFLLQFYHQQGGHHLYEYDVCSGTIDGNVITAYTNARKGDGPVLAQFKLSLTVYGNSILLESYNIKENGVAFVGTFYKAGSRFDNGDISSVQKDINVLVDGNKLTFDQPPVIIDDRTLVPLRAIFEALGATVEWNDESKNVTAVKENTYVNIAVGDYKLAVNDKVIELDVPAQIINGRTLVPVRAVSEAFGCGVEWDGDSSTVNIVSNDCDIDVDYAKYIGTYKRLGGSLGFNWILSIEQIDGKNLTYTYTYEKPGSEKFVDYALFVDPFTAVGKHDEEEYRFTFRDDCIILKISYENNSSYEQVFYLN